MLFSCTSIYHQSFASLHSLSPLVDVRLLLLLLNVCGGLIFVVKHLPVIESNLEEQSPIKAQRRK